MPGRRSKTIFESMIEYRDHLAKAKEQFPGACERCFGDGFASSDDDDLDINPCTECLGRGTCPQCGQGFGRDVLRDIMAMSLKHDCGYELGAGPILPIPPSADD